MVQINISGDTAAEALKDLAALAGNLTGTSVAQVSDNTENKTTTTKKKTTTKKVETTEEDEDAVSLEQVQAKMKEILAPVAGTDAEKALRAKIKSTFGDFGAVSTSTLKPEDYGKVIAAFAALEDDLD